MTAKNKEPPKTLYGRIINLYGKVRDKDYYRALRPFIPWLWGDHPLYRYERNAWYRRVENPDYGPTKRQSLAASLMGLSLTASGVSAGMYPLAYIGATLGLGSLGYYSGNWSRKYEEDWWYEKVSELEAKVQEPDEDKTLYKRRTQYLYSTWTKPPTYYGYKWIEKTRKENKLKHFSPGGALGISWAIVMVGVGWIATYPDKWAAGSSIPPSAPFFYAAGATALASLGHRAGHIFGEKRAKPQYKRISGLDKKIQAIEKVNEK